MKSWRELARRVRTSFKVGWVITMLVTLFILLNVRPGWEVAIFVIASVLVPVPIMKSMPKKWNWKTFDASIFDLNQSQGGMCICRGLGRGPGVPQ